mgnify:CR=1 FL=1
MEHAIETSKLTKYYGKARGIVELDLAVEEGEIFGFIGPNGAGKSTTIRTLLGLIKKSSGGAKIFGMDCEKDKVKILAEVGYLPGEVFYYDRMRAIDLLRYSASFYKKDCTQRIKELADALSLDLNKRIEDMSLGNKKKVGIVQGLLHSPKLIILDEPTSGLDPLQIIEIRELIRSLGKAKTIIFSTHILQEVSPVTDRVVVINAGRIVADGRVGELEKRAMDSNRLFLTVKQDAATVAPALRNVAGVVSVAEAGAPRPGAARFEVRGSFDHDLPAAVSRLARERGWELLELHESRYSLEDTFIALTRKTAAGRGVAHHG